MAQLPRLTREQVEQLNKNTLIEQVLVLQGHLDELSQRVKQLEDQVAKQVTIVVSLLAAMDGRNRKRKTCVVQKDVSLADRQDIQGTCWR